MAAYRVALALSLVATADAARGDKKLREVPSVAKKNEKTNLTEIKTKTKTKQKTKRVKLPRGALRAPLAGSPAFVFGFVFVFVLISVKFV